MWSSSAGMATLFVKSILEMITKSSETGETALAKHRYNPGH